MNALATYALGVGLLIGLATGWLGVQRLWLRSSGETGGGDATRDALAGRFSCGGDGGCGACDGPCERAGSGAGRTNGGENGR